MTTSQTGVDSIMGKGPYGSTSGSHQIEFGNLRQGKELKCLPYVKKIPGPKGRHQETLFYRKNKISRRLAAGDNGVIPYEEFIRKAVR